jgi:hypothetical protein
MFLGWGYLQLHPKAGVEFRQLALENSGFYSTSWLEIISGGRGWFMA